jgi:cytochrome c-type biogenesis protein CcmE
MTAESPSIPKSNPSRKNGLSGSRLKFIFAGGLIVAAIALLIGASTSSNSQYYLTIQELQSRAAQMGGQEVRISGVVLGKTIQYDSKNLVLTFEIANIPGDQKEVDARGGIAKVLHDAASDSSLPRLKVVYHGALPDLMKDEAQAILTGKLASDGTFNASELLLKCPTRYQDSVPTQAK